MALAFILLALVVALSLSGNDSDVAEPDEVIDGTEGDDTLNGSEGDDLIRGFGGDDMLRGAGNDTLEGGGGDDILIWDGADSMANGVIDGGTGQDVLDLRSITDQDLDLVFSDDGTGLLTGNTINVRISGIEEIDLPGNYPVSVDASALIEGIEVRSPTSNDFYWAQTTVVGGSGNDTLSGHVVDGGDGDDVLMNNGASQLTGGAGADTFIANTNWWDEFHNPRVSPVSTHITDYEPGIDLLELHVSLPLPYTDELGDLVTPELPAITIEQGVDGAPTLVLIGATQVMQIDGGPALTLDDLTILVNGEPL